MNNNSKSIAMLLNSALIDFGSTYENNTGQELFALRDFGDLAMESVSIENNTS